MNKENQNNMAFFDMCNAKDLYKKLKSDYEILNKNQEWSTIVSVCNREKHFYLDEKYKKYEKQKNKNTGLFDFGNIDFSNFSFRTCNYEVQVGNDVKGLDEVCEKIMKDYKVILE